MPSLVLLNVPQALFDYIKDWGRQRRLNTDDAAIELLKLAAESTVPPTAGRLGDDPKEIAN
jgi:hypothetical protein